MDKWNGYMALSERESAGIKVVIMGLIMGPIPVVLFDFTGIVMVMALAVGIGFVCAGIDVILEGEGRYGPVIGAVSMAGLGWYILGPVGLSIGGVIGGVLGYVGTRGVKL